MGALVSALVLVAGSVAWACVPGGGKKSPPPAAVSPVGAGGDAWPIARPAPAGEPSSGRLPWVAGGSGLVAVASALAIRRRLRGAGPPSRPAAEETVAG